MVEFRINYNQPFLNLWFVHAFPLFFFYSFMIHNYNATISDKKKKKPAFLFHYLAGSVQLCPKLT